MREPGISLAALGLLAGAILPLEADTVTLRNGDQLSGEILSEEEDSLVFQPAMFPEPLTIPMDSVVSLEGTPGEGEGDTEAREEPAAQAAPSVPADPAPLPPGENSAPESKLSLPENWNATLGLGFKDSQTEVTETREVSAEGVLKWKGDHQEAEWRGFYRYQSQEEEKAADRYGLSQRLRHRGEDGFFVQAQTKAEVDNVTKNRTQVAQTAGIGYSPVKEEKLSVNITPGIKVEHVAQAEKEAALGTAYKAHVDQELAWKVNETVALGQALSYSVDPRRSENWDMDFNAFVETQVSEDVNLRVNYRRDFLNQTAGQDDKKSSELGAALVWNF